MNITDFRFLDPLRVRWAEIDAQHIVFNAHYLMYFDTAVAGYWRALALPYHDTMAQLQGDLYVRKATLEYLGSARYDEQLQVGVRCTRIGTSSMVLAAAVFRGEACLVHGELVYVFADPATQTSRPLPDALRGVLQDYEAGEPMVDVAPVGWSACAAAVQALRRAVLVVEQRLPETLVADDADADALHAVVTNRLGTIVAAARVAPAAGGIAPLSRVVTSAGVRGAGLGTAAVQALLEAARGRGDVAVSARVLRGVRPFFARLGFEVSGDGYTEGGQPHLPMQRPL